MDCSGVSSVKGYVEGIPSTALDILLFLRVVVEVMGHDNLAKATLLREFIGRKPRLASWQSPQPKTVYRTEVCDLTAKEGNLNVPNL